MFVYETIYFEAYTYDQYIWDKNNIAQLYFILGTAELCWNFSGWLRDAPDIYRFPVMHMVKTHFLLENLWVSVACLGLEIPESTSWSNKNINQSKIGSITYNLILWTYA